MRLLTTTALSAALLALPAAAEGPVRLGILLGFTGPVESLMPDIAASAELAKREAGESGLFLGGRSIEPVRADSTCTDAAAAASAAQRLVDSEDVAAIVGADCSGVTTSVVANVTVPAGVVAISPSATTPALTTADDNGLFFRTAPSDARQGQVLAEAVIARGITEVALTYTNNDYGEGLMNSFTDAYQARGGRVLLSAAHEDGKADYSAEVAALAATGAEHLVVFGYVDQGGAGIIRAALDTGAFGSFIMADGMLADQLGERFGAEIDGSFGTTPGSDDALSQAFEAQAQAAGITGTGPYRGEAYDAAALLILAMQAAGSADRGAIAAHILNVANAPGEPIGPGEIARGLEILAAGSNIDWQGATGVELTPEGDAAGTYKEMTFQGGTRRFLALH
ncbi:ABC transporter substrate-binding protein [Rhodobacter calidifons]|uniref:ABC transporter substrate-binding protein n=1 Tax=Rhodobacter calidifons TaxID=2715277 RepID=A0ABX0G9H5_9RHOB|nr:ABC transporter substrate-binding protein [Rhodobacter calidifons]NHB77517.1 ABC transporter substrate-binding protein [Rhodobacter calidifons]